MDDCVVCLKVVNFFQMPFGCVGLFCYALFLLENILKLYVFRREFFKNLTDIMESTLSVVCWIFLGMSIA